MASVLPEGLPAALPSALPAALPGDASELTSALLGAAMRVKATVAESIDGNLSEFNAERDRALAEARLAQATTRAGAEVAASPPWAVLAERFQILEADLKAQIMSLSEHQSTFLEAPAPGAAPFDYHQALPSIHAALAEDPNLKAMRFQLVPARVDEQSFWRNYFDKVHAVKDAILAGSVHLNSIDGPLADAKRRAAGEAQARAAGVGALAQTRADEEARAEADAHAAEVMAERIRRELDLAAAEDTTTAALGTPDEIMVVGAPVAAAPAAAPLLVTPNLSPASEPESQKPVARAEADEHEGGDADDDFDAVDGDDDDGIDLDSDEDLDKLLDLGDDEDGL